MMGRTPGYSEIFIISRNWLFSNFQIIKSFFMQTNNGKNLIIDLSFEFALKIIKYAEILERGHR